MTGGIPRSGFDPGPSCDTRERMQNVRRALGLGVVAFGMAAASCGDDTTSGTTTGGGGDTFRPVSFHADVEPILQQHCLKCHTDGAIGGFSLADYASAKGLAPTIVGQVEAGLMPPFGARDSEECAQRLPWKNDPRLTEDEIAVLRAWSDQGTPEGDPAAAPPPFEPPPIGLPNADLELTPVDASIVEGENDQFTCIVYDPALTEDKWVDGIHFIAGNAAVAHHALTFRVDRERAAELSGGAERFPCFGGAPGDIIHVWAPGGEPFQLPEDVGIKLTPDQVVIVQMHYHPIGAAQEDRSTVQLRFRDEMPSNEFYVTFPGNASTADEGLLAGPDDRGEPEFRIPANAAEHVETMKIEVPKEVFLDLPILMVMPHMHYVGVDLKLEIERLRPPGNQPDSECLVHTPAWDFGWQRFYEFDVPLSELPTARAGDILTITCKYDNSKGNPFVAQALRDRGMSEPVDVFLGEETLDEMCLVPVGVLVPAGIL